MIGGSFFAVYGSSDVYSVGYGIDVEDFYGGLVGIYVRDVISDGNVVVFVGSDLEGRRRERGVSLRLGVRVTFFFLISVFFRFFYIWLFLGIFGIIVSVLFILGIKRVVRG